MDSFQLDPAKAKEGDSQSSRITESGAYTGIITVARHITASTGSQGIELTFKNQEGQEANYLTMYVKNSADQPIYGEKQLHALMACMKVREIAAQEATIEEYDFQSSQNVNVKANIYPQLMNVPVGLVLQSEEYKAKDESTKSRMTLVGFFNAETRQTANEILDQKPAHNLDARLATLKDKKLSQQHPTQSTTRNAQQNQSVDFDDDIPF